MTDPRENMICQHFSHGTRRLQVQLINSVREVHYAFVKLGRCSIILDCMIRNLEMHLMVFSPFSLIGECM